MNKETTIVLSIISIIISVVSAVFTYNISMERKRIEECTKAVLKLVETGKIASTSNLLCR